MLTIENEKYFTNILEDNYFSADPLFEYHSNYIDISYRGEKLEQSINLKKSSFEYQKKYLSV
jgi:beta-galactosidase beta subunit